jgi:hypothetical protein
MENRMILDISDFIFVSDVPRKVDAMFLPGGSHPEQPEYAAKLYHEGYAPLIIPSGGVSVKQDKWPGVRSKADVYNGDYQSDCEFFTDVLVKNGVPQAAIIGEPAVILLDKDHGRGFLPHQLVPNPEHWHIKPPSPLYFYSCCNNFWWCLNNVAKGIARDELPYVMDMLNVWVRSELHDMISWYIGTLHGFSLSTGKACKYIKKYLPPELYTQYTATYSNSDYTDVWAAVDAMCDLFHTQALAVASHFGFTYQQEEEDGIREYLRMVKEQVLEQD